MQRRQRRRSSRLIRGAERELARADSLSVHNGGMAGRQAAAAACAIREMDNKFATESNATEQLTIVFRYKANRICPVVFSGGMQTKWEPTHPANGADQLHETSNIPINSSFQS